MNKRQFVGAALAAATPLALAAPTARCQGGPVLLTVSGAITRANRGPVDPSHDLMMYKQKVTFSTARTFDFAALLALPAVTLRLTLEYDAKVHVLRGPLLHDVLAAAGAQPTGKAQLPLRAVDGYVAALSGASTGTTVYRGNPPGRPADGAGRTGAAMDSSRYRAGAGTGSQATGAALWRLPMVAVNPTRKPRPASSRAV